MSKRTCPECHSTRVVPVSKQYGTSKCNHCGYVGDTSEFEQRGKHP